MKRWKVGKRDWRSWALGSTLIVLFLAQLLIVPSAVQAATATDDVASTNEDTPVTVSVLGNDMGVDLKLASVTAPGNGTATILDESAGTIRYTPASNWNGTDAFTYTVTEGSTSASATVTVTVQPVDDAPVTRDPSHLSILENTGSIQCNVIVSDVDTFSALTYSVVTPPTKGTARFYGNMMTYSPYSGANGTDSFTFKANDGTLDSNISTVTITITPVNDPPSFVKGPDQTAIEDCGFQTVVGWATSISAGPSNESGQTLKFNVTNSNNSLFAVQPAVAANGTLTYTPAANANGTATVTLTLTDDATAGGPALTTASRTFTITVTAMNDPPVNTASPSIAGTMNVGDMLTAAPGTWNDTIDTSVSGSSTLTYTYQWVHADDASGTNAVDIVSATSSLYVLLNSDVHKYLRVRVTCTDNGVGLPAMQSVALSTLWTSQVINGLPVITEGVSTSVVMDEDASPTPFSLALHATDADGDTLTWSVPSGASHGTATASGTGSSKNIGYTPTADYNGSDSFVVQVSDGYGGTDDITVSVTVNSINDIPTFTGGADQTVLEDCGPQTVPSWATSISAGPSNESGQTLGFVVDNNNHALFSVQPALVGNGTLTFTPAADASGIATVTLTLTDDTTRGGASLTTAPQTFTITITPVNDVPSFTKGAGQTVLEDCGLQTVAGWATSISAGPADEAGQTLGFIVNNSSNALFSAQPGIAANGTLTFIPAANQNGSAIVTVQIHDDGGTANASVDTSTPQTFTITVNPDNDPPVDTYTVTYTAGANGVVTGTTPQTVNQGASGTVVTAVPNRGYHFVSWSDGVATVARTDTNVTANINATASFAVDTFAITASAGANGAIDPSGSVSVNSGSDLTFTINPGTGHHVQGVLVDGSSMGAVTSYTFTNLTENHTIAATFAINPITISTYTLTYTAGANGTISGTSPQTVNQGASGTVVTAVPNRGYHFVSWSDGVLTAVRTDTNVTANVNVSASFAINISINRYTLTANVSGSGSVAKSPDQPSYTHGTSVQLMATPATSWHFVGWSGDLAGSTNPTTITMDVSKTVTATYAPLPHPVSRHTIVLTIDIKTMTVDGARVTLDAPAALLEDRTLVPLRAVVEHLGGTISWNAKTRQVTLKARGTTIVLTIGKNTALVNDKPLAIDPKNGKVVPLISSGRTMLPLRFVAENLGLQVEWNAEARTITVAWED